MDQYNAYGVQFDSGTANPYLMQHQIQQMNDSIQEQQHRQMQHGFGYPSSGIDYPGMNDVMCGRGGGTNNHIGNIRFRQLVNDHKLRYLAAPKVDKPRVAMEVVVMWRGLDPPGRFLTKTDATQGDDSLWHDVGDKKAREKASQCLRERTPEVIPFVKQVQEGEKRKKEDGNHVNEGENSLSDGIVMEAVAHVPDSIASSGVRTPDATPSISDATRKMLLPASNQPSTPIIGNKDKKRLTREDFAEAVPTANTFEDVFDDDFEDDNDDDGLTLEAYQNQIQEFLEKAPKGDECDEYSVGERSLLMMETLSSNSWVKSFQSLGSVMGQGSTMMMSMNASMKDIEETDDLPAQEIKQEKSTRSQKFSAIGGQNSISMLSDMTDFKSTRSSKLGASMAPSNLSMMSELTDLSEGIRNMDMDRRRDL